MYQTAGQILLVLLAVTATPTSGGLEKMFENNNKEALIFSIIWSIKTLFTLHLKSVKIEKVFFPLICQISLLVSLLLLSSLSFWILLSTSFSFSSLLLRMASSSAASLNFSSLTVVFSRVSSSSLSLVWSMVYASFGWWCVLFLVP